MKQDDEEEFGNGVKRHRRDVTGGRGIRVSSRNDNDISACFLRVAKVY